MRPPYLSLSLSATFLCVLFVCRSMPSMVFHSPEFRNKMFVHLLRTTCLEMKLVYQIFGLHGFKYHLTFHSESAFGKCTATQLSRALDLIICNRTKCIHN